MEEGPFVVSEIIQKHVSIKILTSMKYDLLIKLRLIYPTLFGHTDHPYVLGVGTVIDPPVCVGAVKEGGLVPPTRHLVQPDAAHAVPKLRIGPHTGVLSRRKPVLFNGISNIPKKILVFLL